MKQTLFVLLNVCLALTATAQSTVDFYGLARLRSGSYNVYLSKINPADGRVTNLSTSSVATSVNLTGAAIDPYANYFYFMGASDIKTLDLTTGNLVRSVTISNDSGAQYFDNFRFNNSDSTIYGLANRVTVTDSSTTSEMFLATINPVTGTVTNISTTPVGYGSALASSAIDPYQRVFYYSTGSTIVGLDMYTGGVYSTVRIAVTDGIGFDNIAYSCADTLLYGLVRQNYYDTIYIDSATYYETVDSTTIRLAKMDPRTGYVSFVSPYSISSGGYSLNSGSTIDPDSMIYYYNNGIELVGVSMATGLIVNQQTVTNSDGDMFELMRIPSNCIAATTALRSPKSTTNVVTLPEKHDGLSVYPNPVTDAVNIICNDNILHVSVINYMGTLVMQQATNDKVVKLDVMSLPKGNYILKVQSQHKTSHQLITK